MLWNIRQRALDLSQRGCIMGILNVTPDSFSDGGSLPTVEKALQRAQELISDGAAIIDIGGESTRPGATPVDEPTELARVLPIITTLRAQSEVYISIDTMKPAVAAAALTAGADIINDVTGFAEPSMRALAAATGAGCVVMHMQGLPTTMQLRPSYGNVVLEVLAFFTQRLADLLAAGVAPGQIVFDPGIGFGKTLIHNQLLLQHLDSLTVAHRPLMLGISRKSFLSQIIGTPDLAHRAWPTVALTSYARRMGVRLHRVHDVRPNYEAMRMTEAIPRPSLSCTDPRWAAL
jgi:dihydropteroate synthase